MNTELANNTNISTTTTGLASSTLYNVEIFQVNNKSEVDELHYRVARAINSAISKYSDNKAVKNLGSYISKKYSPKTSEKMMTSILKNYYDSLLVASNYDDQNIIEMLINDGANVNAKDTFNNTPLHKVMSSSRNAGIMKILIDNGADINAKNDLGDTPLHKAIFAKNNSGDTPLHQAIFNFNAGIIKMLIDNGADINIKNNSGDTPLHKAIFSNNAGIIKMLIDNGADINAKNNSGDTPLQCAERYNLQYEIIEMLKKASNKASDIGTISTTPIPDQDVTTHMTDEHIGDKSYSNSVWSVTGIIAFASAAVGYFFHKKYCAKKALDDSEIKLPQISEPSVTQFMTRPAVQCVQVTIDDEEKYCPIKLCIAEGNNFRPISQFLRLKFDQKQQSGQDIQEDISYLTEDKTSDHYDRPKLPIPYSDIDECGYVSMSPLGVVVTNNDV